MIPAAKLRYCMQKLRWLLDCAGCILANTRLLNHLCWGKAEMGTAISCTEHSRLALSKLGWMSLLDVIGQLENKICCYGN